MAAAVFHHCRSVVGILTLGSDFWRRSWKHRVGRTGLFAVYLYVGILLFLLSLEDYFLYHPTSAADWAPPPPGISVQDVKMTSRDGTSIFAWWSTPPGWRPEQGAVLLCHGNGGNLSFRGKLLRRWLEEMKLAALLFDYPGYGRSGGKPSEAGCYAAGDAAYDWLRQQAQVPAERIVLYGVSLGGGIATDLAVRRPHWALVLVSGFTSFPDMAEVKFPWLPCRWLVHNQMDNLHKIGSVPGPVFITHSRSDALIPFAQAKRLFAAAPEP
jgi:acetyl esterase/lipase